MKYILLVLVSMMFLSCKNEEEVVHALDFDVSGIVLTRNNQTGTYDGTVSSQDCTFTLTGKGEFSHFCYVTSVDIDDIPQNAEGIIGDWCPPTVLKGEWGTIKYLTDKPPYTIEFRLSENKTNAPRNIMITLGFGYWTSALKLTQQAEDVDRQLKKRYK